MGSGGARWARGMVALAALTLVACGGSGSSASSSSGSSPQGSPASSKFNAAAAPLSFSSDAASKTVKFTLVAGYSSANHGLNFDGYDQGALVLSVPTGWTADVTCQNKASFSHNCAVVNGPDTTQPSIPGAGTASVPSGQSATFSFTAPSPGAYRLACLVPGHEAGGMWETLRVTSSGSPSATVTS